MSKLSTNPPDWQSISRDDLIQRLNPHLLEFVSLSMQNNIAKIPSIQLLSPKRLDVISKYIYAKNYLQGIRSGWPVEQYHQHLLAFNDLKEGDKSGKNGIDDFQTAFDAVIESIASRKFSSEVSILPINRDGTLIDGAHRLASAIAVGCEVDIAEMDIETQSYNFRYFQRSGLSKDIIEALVFEYISLIKDIKVAILFPVCSGKENEIESLIGSSSEILYRQQIRLTEAGKTNFVRMLYAEENWIRNGAKDSAALATAVTGRFDKFNNVDLIYFEQPDLSVARKCKETVRSWLDLGNLPIHISDYHIETRRIAEISLNQNGLEWINYSKNKTFPNFDKLFRLFRDQLDQKSRNNLVLDGSSTLAAYGLRDVNDIDYLSIQNFDHLTEAGNHNDELIHHLKSKEELILNPRNYFWHEGIKLISLGNLRAMKSSRGEIKDKADVMMIDGILGTTNQFSRVLRLINGRTISVLSTLRIRLISTLVRTLPKPVKKIILLLLNAPFVLSQKLGPSDRIIDYRGFKLHYPRGASLIRRVQRSQLYEPKVASALVNHLSIQGDGLFLDIGANIGLMTLNVLSKLPATRIIAFEPGPRQLKYLINTIQENALGDQVLIESRAMSNTNGVAQFASHGDVHSSGDGFSDTGRAGKAGQIEVETCTLDTWWKESGKPEISIIKIDTEGAEYWILQGGTEMINENKPVIVLEIQEINLEAYPHSANDLLDFFEFADYRLETLAGAVVDKSTVVEQMRIDENFVGYPRQLVQ